MRLYKIEVDEETYIKFLDEEEQRRMIKIIELKEEQQQNGFYWLSVFIEKNGKKEVIKFTKRDRNKRWNMQPCLFHFTQEDLELLLGEVNREVV